MSPRKTLSAGPFKGVRDTGDPYDDIADPGFLQDAQNAYIPDSAGFSGLYARPAFRTVATPSVTATTEQIAAYTMTTLGGTVYRFVMCDGKLYRTTTSVGEPVATLVDVTPVGITIDGSATATARFYMVGFADELICTDGVNRPWRGTNLSATPITGTYIDIDGAAGLWTAQGPPVVYTGALFFICKTVPSGSSVEAGIGFIWSEPFQPDVGYVQVGSANFWNLVQTSSDPLYALWATNTYLYYFREKSIGAISGYPNVNFSTTASADFVSSSVGCTAPASLCQAGENIYFVDRIGRPHRIVGTEVEELWLQLRGQIVSNPTYLTYPTATALIGIGAFIAQINVVLLGGWSSDPTTTPPKGPSTLYAFNATTGVYCGRWSVASTLASLGIAAMAEMKDTNNTPLLTIVGSPAGSAYKFYTLQPLGLSLWTDGTTAGTLVVPTISAQTQRLGYSATTVYNASDVGTAVVGSTAPVTITVKTPYTSSTTEATAKSPNGSSDDTYLVDFGMDVQAARGIQVTLSPTTASSQWILHHVEFPATPSTAVEEK